MSSIATRSGISLTASDVSGQKQVDIAGVPGDATVGELVEGLLAKMRLPTNDPTGQPITFQARLDREGRHLNAAELVGDALQENDRIVLQPRIMAG